MPLMTKSPAKVQPYGQQLAVRRVSESDDDLPLVEGLGLPGKHVNYGVTGSEECPKTKLDAADKVVIDSVFREVIEAGRLLTKHEVRAKMREDSHLRKYAIQHAKVKKISDFLRYQTNQV